MKTAEYNSNLPQEEKLRLLKEACKGTRGEREPETYAPYCMMCGCSSRMIRMDYGFKCPSCGNMIGWDLERLEESPLNKPNRLNPDLEQSLRELGAIPEFVQTPTLADAAYWISKKFGLDITVDEGLFDSLSYYIQETGGDYIDIISKRGGKWPLFDKYEDALEDAIDLVVEILKEKLK